MVHLDTPSGQILFTGDYSVGAQATVPALVLPSVATDIVVSEATYGERLHEDRAAAEGRLIDQIRQVIERGGRVLIPAFAIGRAQEVLRILKRAMSKQTLPPVPVRVDGMVRGVCDVYQRHPRWVSRQLEAEIRHGTHPFYTENLVVRLEKLGLVRRDDRRRNRLWVLAPHETDAYPEEAAREQAVREENPKGELLELCTRIGCAAPTVDASVEGAYHLARIALTYDGKQLQTREHRASNRKTSEQLAARELLGLLDEGRSRLNEPQPMH